MDKKYLLIILFWLVWFAWRSLAYFHSTPSDPKFGIIKGMVFAEYHGYQRGVKIHLLPQEKRVPEYIFPVSYSGTFKKYNVEPGKYNVVFTKSGFSKLTIPIVVKEGEVTKIPSLTLQKESGSPYFYHFVHWLNIFAFCVLLSTGISTYYLKEGDQIGKTYLRFCIIMSFWNLWGVVSYVLEAMGQREIGGHLTYLSLWTYSFMGVSYCHIFAVFPQPFFGKKTKAFLSWLYVPALLLFPVEFVRVLFWYRPDYSRFLGFPQQITDTIIMLFFILYLALGNTLLFFSLLKVKVRTERIQLAFLFFAACFPPILFSGTLGAMYLFGLDYFFDNDMLFLTSLTQIIVSVAFAYSLVMVDYVKTTIKLQEQKRLAFLGRIDAKLYHDIGVPILSLRNLNQTLHQLLAAGAPKEKLLETSNYIQDNISKVLSLINQIRADLRQDKKMDSQDIPIEELVDEALETVKRGTDKHIAVLKTFSKIPALRLYRDGFLSALLNVFQNSVDSFQDAGTIEITGVKENGWIKLIIKDDGCGIENDKIDKIFDSFYTTKKDGTGLGLSFVKQEIQRYGGEVSCSSQPGEGTTITITLPIRQNVEGE